MDGLRTVSRHRVGQCRSSVGLAFALSLAGDGFLRWLLWLLWLLAGPFLYLDGPRRRVPKAHRGRGPMKRGHDDVGGHDVDRVLEVDVLAFRVGEAAGLQDLE